MERNFNRILKQIHPSKPHFCDDKRRAGLIARDKITSSNFAVIQILLKTEPFPWQYSRS